MKKIVIILLILSIVVMSSGCTYEAPGKTDTSTNDEDAEETQGDENTSVDSEESTKVWFLDVGEGDSILIVSGEEAMLIDTGNKDSDDEVIGFLEEKGIEKIDYLVTSHAHADHIGEATDIVNTFEVGTVMDSGSKFVTSKTYEGYLEAVYEKNLTYVVPQRGDSFTMGDAQFTVLNPDETEPMWEANEESIVLMMTVGEVKFLFEGDAEKENEEQILEDGYDVDVDVLKVAHHGSDSSSCQDWLDAVSPELSVISVGEGNSYGHPNNEVIGRLEEFGIISRTDMQGNVFVETDGEDFSVEYDV